jgi:predicted neuraminidase
MSASWSGDAGRTWTQPAPTALPNRDSGLCAIRLSDGDLLCAYNDISPGKRENLRLALSEDEGRTWETVATIAEEAGHEFSYPYLIRGADGMIRMVYSARQTQIVFAEFSEAWVREQEVRP